MSTSFSVLAATITAFKAMKTRHALDRNMATAQRAELPLDPNCHEDHKYRNLLHATHGSQTEDGMYICCCGAENTIVHFTGAHPFKFLNCRVCNHTFCGKCTSSEILTPLKVSTLPAFEATLTTASHLGQICPDCGLTHRSINKSLRCACGSISDDTWVTFAILSPDKYKYDPNAAFVKLKVGRANKAVKESMQKSVPQVKCLDVPIKATPTCGLKRSGAIRRKGVVV